MTQLQMRGSFRFAWRRVRMTADFLLHEDWETYVATQA